MRKRTGVVAVLLLGMIAGTALAVSLTWVTSFGSAGSGSGQFNLPAGVAVSGGLVYVADSVNNRIVVFDPNNFAATFTTYGSFGFGSGQFNTPGGVAVSGGLVYVADTVNNRIVVFDPNNFAASFTSYGSFGPGSGQFINPEDVAVSGGLVYVADQTNSRIDVFNPANFAGTFTSYGGFGSGSGKFGFPEGVAVSGGLVYVADTVNNRIVVFDPNNFAASFTSYGGPAAGSGPGQFDNPIDVAVSGDLLYVADFSNNRIDELRMSLPGAVDASYQVRYAANLNSGVDSAVNIINTGANGNVSQYGPSFGTASNGNICVNVYALDPNEELLACCSCLVTPNQVVSLQVHAGIMGNLATGGAVPNSATIKLLGSTGSAVVEDGVDPTDCNNTAATVSTTGPGNTVTGGYVAFGTTPHVGRGGLLATTETAFLPATLSPSELASLSTRCASILGNGSGHGVCPGCQNGALGAAKK